MKEIKQILCEALPNTQIVLDEQGFKWYRKGLNSSKDRIFHSCALHGCYARAWTNVNDNVLNITKEHDVDEHSNLKNKEGKKGKYKKNLLEAIPTKPKKIKENKELYVTSNKTKEKKRKHEVSFHEIVTNDLPFDPNDLKFEWKSDDNQPTNKQTEYEANKENLFKQNNPPDITYARIKKVVNQDEIIDCRKEIVNIKSQLNQIFNYQIESKDTLLNLVKLLNDDKFLNESNELLNNIMMESPYLLPSISSSNSSNANKLPIFNKAQNGNALLPQPECNKSNILKQNYCAPITSKVYKEDM